MKNYLTISNSEQAVPIKAWIKDVPFDNNSKIQVEQIAQLDFIYKHIAIMPDAHMGIGATIGSVIPSVRAVIPAAVGVDLGCGMVAMKTSLDAKLLPDKLSAIRSSFERSIPHGRSKHSGKNDRGAWYDVPEKVAATWQTLLPEFKLICEKHPAIKQSNNLHHLGTLGTGNHFVELCLDETNNVWIMLHSGSRGVGNRIGNYFISKAKKEMDDLGIKTPNKDLAYLREESPHFKDYVQAVDWAQRFAYCNREIMLENAIIALKKTLAIPFTCEELVVNCHHNYIAREFHFGEEVYVTRKGAVNAEKGRLGIIPGSMGAKSFIVRGLGNTDSFNSCSHGAGRVMSRTEAKKTFSVEDQIKATEGVECRKDKDVIDEIPMAYKDIDKVMAAQSDLVEILYTLKQVICVKG